MKNELSRFKSVIAKSEFKTVWIALALLVFVFAINAFFLSSLFFVLMSAVLLLAVFIIFFASMYASVRADKGSTIEGKELKSVLKGFDDALIVYNDRFEVIFFNLAAERLFKIESKDIIGERLTPQNVERSGWTILTQVIFPSLAPNVIGRSKEGELPEIVDISFTDPALELRVMTAPIIEDDGRTFAFMKIVRDRSVEIAALRSNTDFVTVASHQLRGPLTDISWALQSLQKAEEMNETSKSIVTSAFAAAQGLLRRIDQLLSIAKIEEGQFGYNFEDYNIVDFLGKILNDILPQAHIAGIKIYLDKPETEIPHVTIDPQQLSIAMVNIMENSIRYNVVNGEVIVKVEKMEDKPFLSVTVRDTGIGIPEKSLEKLFTKFFRADNAVRSQTEGSGLGLYIAKNIIAAHGGEISVASELNRGTIITFTLPTDPNLVPKQEAKVSFL